MAIAGTERVEAPLSGYRVASTTRADEAACIVSRTYCGHEVRILDPVRSARFRFRFCEAALARTGLGAMSFDADFHYDLGETDRASSSSSLTAAPSNTSTAANAVW